MRRLFSKFALLLWLLPAAPFAAADSAPLQIAFVESAFLTVNQGDAVAAMTVWAETLLRNRGLDSLASVEVYPGLAALERAIQAGRADVISLSASDYLLLRNRVAIDPAFLAEQQGGVMDRYALMVHRGSEIRGLADLQGTEILLMLSSHMTLGREWFRLLYSGEIPSLPPPRLVEVTKILSALMPVYLRQKSACLVPRNAMAPAVELNPQLGRDLVELRSSPEMSTAVVCLRKGYTLHREAVLEELAALHEKPHGQQIMLLLKYAKLAPFQESALDSTRELMVRAGLLPDAPGGGGAP